MLRSFSSFIFNHSFLLSFVTGRFLQDQPDGRNRVNTPPPAGRPPPLQDFWPLHHSPCDSHPLQAFGLFHKINYIIRVNICQFRLCKFEPRKAVSEPPQNFYLCGCHAVLDSVLDLSKHRIKNRMATHPPDEQNADATADAVALSFSKRGFCE